MSTINPIKGAGQMLKVFERSITYVTTDNVSADSDGYVRGDRENKYDIKAAVVPQSENQLSSFEYGDSETGEVNVYIRTKHQDIDSEVEISAGDYFLIDNNEWKINVVNDYDTVIICSCTLSSEGGYPIA